jgi:uncharacterized membrane protein YbhN (UPF0104 family)
MERLRSLAGSLWVRALVSAGLLAAVLLTVDFGAARDKLAEGSWGWFVGAVVALFASFLVAGFRWRLFLDAAAIATTTFLSIRAYLIGAFTNNFLPGQAGGDVTRAWVVSRPGTRTSAITTVVVDRATALACLVLAAWIALAADPEPVAGTLIAALAASTAALVVGLGVAALLVRGGTGLGRRLPPRARVWLTEAQSTVRACVRARVIARTAALGLAFEGLVILALWLVAKAIDVDVSYSVLAVVLPPVLIVSALPISIAGYGVREASFVVLLGHVGIGSTDATLLSLIGGVAFAIASLPGGLLLLQRAPVEPAKPVSRSGASGP